jgi:DNA-binding NarL/FixJ family response regulator
MRLEGREKRICNVAIIDQEPLLLEALKRRIATIPGVKVISHLTSEEPSVIAAANPDVVVCDPSSGTIFEMAYLAKLKSVLPLPKFIVFTNHEEPQAVVFSLANGHSFVLKSEPIETIRCAIELVCRGGVALSVRVAAILANRVGERHSEVLLPTPVSRALSPREAEVLGLIGRGYTDAEIGEILGISARTAQRHLTNVLNKLNCRNRSEAVARMLGSDPT